jgi:pimeloyl-ACP methyl ester carboxylesterase
MSKLERTTSFNVHDDHFIVTDLNNVETNCIVFKQSKRRSARRNLVLITPGNPGVSEFYYEFARLLFEQSSQRDDICVVSHAGHCGRDIPNNEIFSLKDQIEHKLVVIDQLCSQNSELCNVFGIDAASKESPLVLLGHSIGAYINMKLSLARPQAPIDSIVNLFPTFRYVSVFVSNGVCKFLYYCK